jgi:ferric-dicitrate binding protein FerR (iron transport regulator)
MKKNVLIIVLVLAAASAYAQSGVIKELAGTVEIKGVASAVFVPAKAGDQVKEDTVISTGFKSSALIEVGSTVIAVRPLTRLTLKEIKASQGSETFNVSLQTGRIRVDVNPPAGAKASMAVVSPTATASVRGTSFEFDTKNLHVNNGNVILRGARSQGTLITAGFNATTDISGNAVNPLDFGIDAYKPQTPVGTQPNTAPSAATVTPVNPDNGNTGGGVIWN